MRKKALFVCFLIIMILAVAGCGSMPNLTSEQEEMISEYATALLLKYDSENHSRLVDTSEFMNAYNEAKSVHDEAEKAYYDAIAKEEAERRNENDRQEQGINQSQESATANSGDRKGAGDGTGGAVVVNAQTIAEFLDMGDFSIEYAGCDVMDVYPEDAEDFSVTIPATKGTSLLVVYFNAVNKANDSRVMDIYSISPSFKLSVNEGGFSSVLITYMLDEDMTLYKGNFSAGETKRLVLLMEVKKGINPSKLSLRITRGSNSLTKILK